MRKTLGMVASFGTWLVMLLALAVILAPYDDATDRAPGVRYYANDTYR